MPTPQKIGKEPLYRQVRDLLAQRIAQGEWRPGAVLPSEDDLARELSISMGTVRRALDSLEDERLVLRRQGRGTTVIDQASQQAASRFYNVTDDRGQPLCGDVEVLKQSSGTATERERERLQLGPGDKVWRCERLRRAGGRAFMLEQVALALAHLPGFDPNIVGHYQLLVIAQDHGLQLSGAQEHVSVAHAAPAVAARLQIAPNTPVLQLDRVVLTGETLPVEWRTAHCHLKHTATYTVRMK